MAEEKKKTNIVETIANTGKAVLSALSKANNSSSNGENTTTSDKKINTAAGEVDYGTYQDDLNKLSKAQMNAQIQNLKQAREATLKSLDQEEEKISPTYQNARNSTTATSMKNAKSFNEYLNNRGLYNSGSAAQAEMNRTSNLNNNMASLDKAEADAYANIESRRQQAETDYNNGVANAKAGIDASYYQNMLNYNQQQRQYLQQLQQQANTQYADDYQARINELLAQGYSPNSLEVLQLQALRGQKINNQYNNAMNNASNLVSNGIINYNNAAALGMTQDQAQAYYDNLVAQQQAQAQAEAEQLAYDRQRQETNDYWTNAYKQAQINQMYNKASSTGNGTTEDKQLTTSQINTVISKLNDMSTQEEQLNYINVLRDTGGLGTGDYADNMWRSLYKSIYGINTNQETTPQAAIQTTTQTTTAPTNQTSDILKKSAQNRLNDVLSRIK